MTDLIPAWALTMYDEDGGAVIHIGTRERALAAFSGHGILGIDYDIHEVTYRWDAAAGLADAHEALTDSCWCDGLCPGAAMCPYALHRLTLREAWDETGRGCPWVRDHAGDHVGWEVEHLS